MLRVILGRTAAVAASLAMICGPVIAQQQVQVVIDRGLTEDIPYTAIYPNVLRTADDDNPATFLTLEHPSAFFQCHASATPTDIDGWAAEAAVSTLDVARVEAGWAPTFPGFRLTAQSVARFASGPALFYEGVADNSPFGVPVSLVHAEAVENGLLYIVECLLEQATAAQARPMADFIIANFATNSDGQCCIDPADDRG